MLGLSAAPGGNAWIGLSLLTFMQKLKAKAASTATDLEVVLKEQLSSLRLGPGVTVAKPTGTQNVVTTAAIAVSTAATVTNQPEFKSDSAAIPFTKVCCCTSMPACAYWPTRALTLVTLL